MCFTRSIPVRRKIPFVNPETGTRVYTTVRLTTEKPNIDGRLDDECWKLGTWAGDFIPVYTG